MKAGWQTKTLEEACEFSNGLWKGEKEPFVVTVHTPLRKSASVMICMA
jgi:hypothetical protein